MKHRGDRCECPYWSRARMNTDKDTCYFLELPALPQCDPWRLLEELSGLESGFPFLFPPCSVPMCALSAHPPSTHIQFKEPHA